MQQFYTCPISEVENFTIQPHANPVEKARNSERFSDGWHIRPGSTLVASIGNSWQLHCWNRVVDMVMWSNFNGYNVWLQEIAEDHINFPMANTQAMRDSAIIMGRNAGFDKICLIDNDVLPRKETLISLLDKPFPCVAPYIWDEGEDKALGIPRFERGLGMQPMRWVGASFMLFDAKVFNCPDIKFTGLFQEGQFGQLLAHYGHKFWMDTDFEVQTVTPPGRVAQHKFNTRMEMLEERYNRSEIPNRKAIDSDSPWVKDGIYCPFLFEKDEQLEYFKHLETQGDISKLVTMGVK
jgi:hypothetical protein